MKNLSFSFLLITFFATPFVFAELPIFAEPSVLDFGRINENEGTLELSLKLWNRTTQTVKITNTRTSCGCTITELKQPTISVKGYVDVKVKINIAGYKGKFDKNIYFDIEEESLTVSVRGFVVSDIWFPETMIQIFPKNNKTIEKTTFVLHTIEFPNVQFNTNILDPIFTLREKDRTKNDNETQIEYELTVNTTNIKETQSYRLALIPTDKTIKPLYIPVGIYVINSEIDTKYLLKTQLSERLSPKQVNVGLLQRGVLGHFKIFGNANELVSLKIEQIENFPAGTKIELSPFKNPKNKNPFDTQEREVSVLVPESTKIGSIKGCVYFMDLVGNKSTINVIAIVIPKR
jgi:hypothetical protein